MTYEQSVRESVNINIRISPVQRRAFNAKAEREGFHQAEVLRRLIAAYIEGRISVKTIIKSRRETT